MNCIFVYSGLVVQFCVSSGHLGPTGNQNGLFIKASQSKVVYRVPLAIAFELK